MPTHGHQFFRTQWTIGDGKVAGARRPIVVGVKAMKGRECPKFSPIRKAARPRRCGQPLRHTEEEDTQHRQHIPRVRSHGQSFRRRREFGLTE